MHASFRFPIAKVSNLLYLGTGKITVDRTSNVFNTTLLQAIQTDAKLVNLLCFFFSNFKGRWWIFLWKWDEEFIPVYPALGIADGARGTRGRSVGAEGVGELGLAVERLRAVRVLRVELPVYFVQ